MSARTKCQDRSTRKANAVEIAKKSFYGRKIPEHPVHHKTPCTGPSKQRTQECWLGPHTPLHVPDNAQSAPHSPHPAKVPTAPKSLVESCFTRWRRGNLHKTEHNILRCNAMPDWCTCSGRLANAQLKRPGLLFYDYNDTFFLLQEHGLQFTWNQYTHPPKYKEN